MGYLVTRFHLLIIAMAICAASLPARSEAGKREKPRARAKVALLKGHALQKLRAWEPSTPARVLTHVCTSSGAAIVVDAVARAFGFDLPAPFVGLTGHLAGRVTERVLSSPGAGNPVVVNPDNPLRVTPENLLRVASRVKDKIVASTDYQFVKKGTPWSEKRNKQLVDHLATVEQREETLAAMAGKTNKRSIFARLKAKLAGREPGYRLAALLTSMLSGGIEVSNAGWSGVIGWASGRGAQVGMRTAIDGAQLREIAQQLNEIEGDVKQLEGAGIEDRQAR